MPGILKTKVTLRLDGDDLNPHEVTRALGHPPDKAVTRGAAWLTPRGTDIRSRTGRWRLCVPRRIPGDLDGQIMELLNLLTDDLDVWRDLTTRFSADVFCGLFLDESNEGCSLPASTLLALGQRGLELDLDIYHLGSDD